MLGGDCGKRMIDVGHGKYCTQVRFDQIWDTVTQYDRVLVPLQEPAKSTFPFFPFFPPFFFLGDGEVVGVACCTWLLDVDRGHGVGVASGIGHRAGRCSLRS